MPLSWNEIRDRSLAFTREWADESSEDAEAKSFWDGFLLQLENLWVTSGSGRLPSV